MLRALSLVTLSACAAPAAEPEGPPVYLALGDSVAFGYDPLVAARNEVDGYPEVLGARIGLPVVNASCPGEASGGFISPTGNDNSCRENRLAYPLHVDYEGTQLGFAYEFLRDHPNTALVTIDIGANDASKLNDLCAGDTACVLGGFIPMLLEYSRNLDEIFHNVRKVYDGPLVAVAIYNPFPTDTLAQYGLERLNAVLATQVSTFDGIYVDGMGAFATAAGGGDPCATGLLIAMPDGTCDIHPSPAGDDVLAAAIEAAL